MEAEYKVRIFERLGGYEIALYKRIFILWFIPFWCCKRIAKGNKFQIDKMITRYKEMYPSLIIKYEK